MVVIALITKNNSKVFTQFKTMGWIVTLVFIVVYIGGTMNTIHLLSTHDEYYPEYFLPESVLGLILLVVMVIICLCEYPFIYGTVAINTATRLRRFSYTCGSNHKCSDLISRHLSAFGWAGPIYSIQIFAVTMVHSLVRFFADPLAYVIDSMGFLILVFFSVIVFHELYLMIRHPKNCCYCKNLIKILLCIAVVLSYYGLASSLLLLLKHYKDLSPLVDSTKLVQYLISSAFIGLLGYFGRKKITEILKESEDGDRDIDLTI